MFVSYSAKDAEWVRKSVDALRERGLSVWYAPSGLKPGTDFPTQVREALKGSSIVLLFLSPHSIQSNWAAFEVGMALALGKRIVPITRSTSLHFDVPVPLRHMDVLRVQHPKKLADQVEAIVRRPQVDD